MAAPIENQICEHCGEPAIEGRVELDGRVSYLCARHIEMNGPAPDEGKTGGKPASDKPKP